MARKRVAANPDIEEAATLAADLAEAADGVDSTEYAQVMRGKATDIPPDTLAALRDAVPAVLRARALMSRDVAVTLGD